MPEYITLVLRKSVAELGQPVLKKILEDEILPTYLAKRRWFAAKDAGMPKLEINCQPAFPEIAPSRGAGGDLSPGIRRPLPAAADHPLGG